MRIAAAVCLVLSIAGPASGSEPTTLTWKVDGVERRAIVYAPASRTMPSPLVFAFHGAGDTADNFAGVDLQTAWPEAVVVYMDGLSRGAGRGGAFQTTDGKPSNRDLRFFDTALADLHRQFNIDSARVYAMGFSNGARFVYLLWAARADLFAAFAPVAGAVPPGLNLTEPKPLLHIGGREDHQVEFTLQLAAIDLARQADHTGAGKPCGGNCTVYPGASGISVMTVLHPDGHVYPSDATNRIVAFFREQRRSGRP